MPNQNMQMLADEGIYGDEAEAIDNASEEGMEQPMGSQFGPGTLPDGRMEGINPQMDPKERARGMAYTMLLQQLLGTSRDETMLLIESMGGYGPVAELLQGGRPEEIQQNLDMLREWIQQMRGAGQGMAIPSEPVQ